jgi:pimeloyl-ACP methyl ester carboxylesterase
MQSVRTIGGTDVLFAEHWIKSDNPNIELYLRNKRPRSLAAWSPSKTIVMVHGATFSSGSLYDVALGGVSFMDYLAAAGFDVFAVDVRGYGRSTRPESMQSDADLNLPTLNTDIGVRDFTSAVEFVLKYRAIDRTNIFAMSWGGTVAGTFAARNADKTEKVALLAPQWLSDKPIPIDPGGPLGSYRLVPVLEGKARWLSTAPEHGRATLIPDGWFEQWARATLAEDPWSTEQTPGRLRATNGPIQDIREYWRVGNPYYQPSEITSPVLLVHGEWDIDVPIELALAYFKELKNARYRRWIEIGEATHLTLLEKNRMLAFKAIADFFGEQFSPE